ncbi:MUC1-extracellular alpha-1 4-glucan glucosidase [Fusarium pseudocircinatum]|uniref:MUC1-extracellular alpha-1 4-glucan glucosidase n=1 Tax=Fusarium pseudocircinatum TaxID=56676 RepID=A0A8H5KS89_9HYPO|nr:MUC1-extracellular alpha-1 4-glucan glucosidase [Fusarium pseudocircinatum]
MDLAPASLVRGAVGRCDIDDVCSAVLYEDPTGSCYLAADFTSTSPSNGYSVAIKGVAVSEPETPTTTTEVSIATTTEVSTTVAATTEETSTATEVTSEVSTIEVSSIASTSEASSAGSTTEVTSEASTTRVSSIATTSEASSVTSSTEVTSAASTTKVSTIGSTSETSSVASTSGVSSVATTSEVTSLASTSDDCDETETSTEMLSTLQTSSSPLSDSTSGAGTTTTHSLYVSTTSVAATTSQTSTTSDKSTAETSSVSTLATVITSQGTESILSTSNEITTSTDIQSSRATTSETTPLSTLTTLTRPASLSTTETQAITTAKPSSATSHGISQTVSAPSASTYVYVNPGSETLSASGSTIKAPYPTGYTIRTVYQTLTKGVTCTKTTFAETVTTATYVTVGPSHSTLITTCVPVTLLYSPCYCGHEVYPTLSMTTVVSPCSACGSNGENTVTLTVPEAACETTSGSYSHPIVQYPSGWTGGYQTTQNGTGNHEAQYTVKSHGQPQGSPKHTYTNVQPSVPAPTAGAYSHTQSGNNQLFAPIPTAGSPSNSQETKDNFQNEAHSIQGEVAHPTGLREAEAPGSTSVAISGADRVQAIMWIVVAVVAGMV